MSVRAPDNVSLEGLGLVAQDFDILNTGEMIPPRLYHASEACTLATGTVGLTFFTASRSETINTLTAYSGSSAAGANATLSKIGIYSIAANGDGTLIVSTANDPTMFLATYSAYARSLTSSWNKVYQQRYATALLVVGASPMPNFLGQALVPTGGQASTELLSPIFCARILAQVDLPASFIGSALAPFAVRPAILMTP